VAQPESSAAHPPQPAVADSTARLAAASSAVVAADAIEEKAPAERAAPSGSLSDIELKTALPPLSPADLKAPASEVVRDRDRNDGRTREAEVSQDGAESLEPAEPPAQGPPARFGQHLLARVEERSDSGRHLSEADQTRFVERVARAVRLAEGREGVLRLRLSPPELGSLRLEVRVHHGVLAARLETETSAARSLLVDNLQVLRERLAEQGVRVEQFDVDLRDGRQRESLDAGPQWRQRDPSERRPAEHPLPDEAHAGPGASGPAPLNGMRQLDVKV
jgi:flagellar hook-length control protein FliK